VSDGPDLAALLATLDRHGVRHIVCGSVGALAHGAPDVRPGDLDVVRATDQENLQRLADALRELEAVPTVVTGAWQPSPALTLFCCRGRLACRSTEATPGWQARSTFLLI